MTEKLRSIVQKSVFSNGVYTGIYINIYHWDRVYVHGQIIWFCQRSLYTRKNAKTSVCIVI